MTSSLLLSLIWMSWVTLETSAKVPRHWLLQLYKAELPDLKHARPEGVQGGRPLGGQK